MNPSRVPSAAYTRDVAPRLMGLRVSKAGAELAIEMTYPTAAATPATTTVVASASVETMMRCAPPRRRRRLRCRWRRDTSLYLLQS
jgi:hypothetical protein